MSNPPEILDDTFGTLSLFDEADDESVYFAEVPWNRGLYIQLFIHLEGKDHQKCIKNVKIIFSSVRDKEMQLFDKGMEYLTSNGFIGESDENNESFLNDTTVTSIEIFSNGEGQLVYLVMMVGSLAIEFSSDASFQDAQAIAG